MKRAARRQPETLRDLHAQQAAITHYRSVYDHFATSAQLYAGTELQQTVGEVAVMFLLAADAEQNDPEPKDAPDCRCAMCLLYRTGFR